ncbi:FkbM family methyltransferase [Sporocytophaga myxococcoides]|uniref:FkbM family methyltransferase n=1 Tax=Sporocytophaga myxococcoides TaxID=153721 RepID=UPI00041CF1A8|nr:FkbM family methyltransferase [Sporocytophaga myxococcoides]
MRTELLYNPILLIQRLGEFFFDKKRLRKVKGTPAASLSLNQLDSLEFLQIIMEEIEVNTIYDLGANVGTWSLLAKTMVPKAAIHAFEPIKEYQEKFLANTRKVDNVRLHKIGIGNMNGEMSMHIAGHSSSFLEITEAITNIFPNERKTGEVFTPVRRLDDYVHENNLPYPQLMKLDVEGYELEVLKNASECLKRCQYLILEVSFSERHKGQALFHEIISFLGKNNFYAYAFPCNMHVGQPITVTDILFKKQEEL